MRTDINTHYFQYNDGGRMAAGFKGTTGDCGVRAIAIASGLPYADVYESINEFCKTERKTKGRRTRSSARTGIYATTFKRYMKEHGWLWTPTMSIGSGCTVHMRADELPAGRLILNVSKHYTAFINGVIHDTYDPSRGGTRCVYGYWTVKE